MSDLRGKGRLDLCAVCAKGLPRLAIGRIASKKLRWVCSESCKKSMHEILALEGKTVHPGLPAWANSARFFPYGRSIAVVNVNAAKGY